MSKLDYDGLAYIKWFNKEIKKLNPDTTFAERKKFIIDHVTHHKYMTKTQAIKFLNEIKLKELIKENKKVQHEIDYEKDIPTRYELEGIRSRNEQEIKELKKKVKKIGN